MRTYKIIDEFREEMLIGFLFYHEGHRQFTLEINEELNPETAPVFFESFIRKGQLTLAPDWADRWVQQRVIPYERQNLGSILKENKMKVYDPFKLMVISEGRCAQDDLSIVPVKVFDLPDWIRERLNRRIEYVLALDPKDLIIFWRDGSVWRTDINEVLSSDRDLKGSRTAEQVELICKKPGVENSVRPLAGGTGVTWGSDINIYASALYGKGEIFPVEKKLIEKLMKYYMISTAEVCSELNCSRQYVSQLVSSHELPVIKEEGRIRLYSKSDVDRIKD